MIRFKQNVKEQTEINTIPMATIHKSTNVITHSGEKRPGIKNNKMYMYRILIHYTHIGLTVQTREKE